MTTTAQRANKLVALVLAAIGLLAVLVLVGVASTQLPTAVDWSKSFYPAAQVLVRGDTPYVEGFHNPPWALLPLLPFAANEQVGRGALLVISLVVYGALALHAGAGPLVLGLWLTCPPLLHTLLHGNVEWLVLAGLLLPPRWGLFAVLIKPQVAGAVAVFWTVEAWRAQGWRGVVALWWPVTLALVASVAVYGWWPANSAHMPSYWWNASLWPLSLVPGAVLMWLSVRDRDYRYALAASPMLSPYVLFHSWSGAVLATVHDQRLFGVVVIGLWVLVARQGI